MSKPRQPRQPRAPSATRAAAPAAADSDRPLRPRPRRRPAAPAARRPGGGQRDALGVDAALEAVRRLGAQPQALRRAADGARDRRWPPRAATDVVVADTSLSAPPMTPASATAPRSSAMTMSPACSARSTPSSVVIRSPRPARRTWMPPRELVEVERVQRVAQLEQHVVGDVDQVRDRAHPARRQPQPHRTAGWARR